MSKSSTRAGWLRARAEQAPLVAVWAAGAALTAVGMYSVAVACGIPGNLAWLYPLIFDGLALVAYRASSRTKDGAQRYAAFVVVLCTGLSALAQAAHLAAGDGLTSGATTHLKAGVGAAPAIAVALAAHLHWLTTRPAKLAASLAPDVGAATGQGERHAPALPAPTDPGTAHRPSGVVPADADRGDEPSQASPVGPGPDAVITSRVAVSAGRGSSGPAAAPPARTLTVVAPDTADTRRTGVSAAAGASVRTVVSARADSAPDTTAGQLPDTLSGQPDTRRPDTRTPALDTTRSDTGQALSGQADEVSELLLSGRSVRQVAATTGQSKSTVGDRRRDLVNTGQLPPAKGRQ